jgi:glutamine cyclotransferase
METKTNEIEYKGIKYALVFNLNVMETIQGEYGSVEAWGDLTEKEPEPDAKAIKYGFTEMLNEGIDIYNEDHDDKKDFFTTKQVGRMLTELGLQNVAKVMQDTVIDSTKSDEKN